MYRGHLTKGILKTFLIIEKLYSSVFKHLSIFSNKILLNIFNFQDHLYGWLNLIPLDKKGCIQMNLNMAVMFEHFLIVNIELFLVY